MIVCRTVSFGCRALASATAPVTIDDASAFLARFANGSLATFEATRYARGHKALYTLEINGEHGSIAWDLHDLHRLQFFDHRDEGALRGWRSIHVTDGDHPYMDRWWVPGLQIGYEHSFVHQVADFLRGLDEGRALVPDFRDGLATDLVTDAVLASARERRWVTVTRSASQRGGGVAPVDRHPVECVARRGEQALIERLDLTPGDNVVDQRAQGERAGGQQP